MKVKLNPRIISLALSLIGVGGVGVTSWLSIKCHEKAKDKTEKKDKAICYIPAIGSGLVTAGCILGSHHVSSKEIAALTATAGYLTANRDKIKKKLEEVVGTEKAKEIETQAAVEAAKENKQLEKKTNPPKKTIAHGESIEWTGKGPLKCLEGYSGRYFYSTLEAVKDAQKKLNNRLHCGEYVCLNDLYELYGITKTHFGHQFGWPSNSDFICNVDEDEEPIEFENTIVQDDFTGETILLIDIHTYPMECWQEV